MKYLFVSALVATTLYACSSGSDKSKEGTDAEPEKSSTVSVVNAGDLKIGYYNVDSIPARFDLYKSELASIEKEGKQLEAQAKQIQDKYEKIAQAYESGMRTQSLTPNQQISYEQQLQQLQQEMMEFQNSRMAAFQNKQMTTNQAMQNKITLYGQEFAKDKGLNMFLIAGAGSSVAFADAKFDLTNDFIDYINKKEKELNGSK